MPSNPLPRYLGPSGSHAQGALYAHMCGDLWRDTPGALDLLRRIRNTQQARRAGAGPWGCAPRRPARAAGPRAARLQGWGLHCRPLCQAPPCGCLRRSGVAAPTCALAWLSPALCRLPNFLTTPTCFQVATALYKSTKSGERLDVDFLLSRIEGVRRRAACRMPPSHHARSMLRQRQMLLAVTAAEAPCCDGGLQMPSGRRVRRRGSAG